MKRLRNNLFVLGTAIVLLGGCSEEHTTPQTGTTTPGNTVNVTLPFAVAPTENASGTLAAKVSSTTKAAPTTATEGFYVSFEEDTSSTNTDSTNPPPSTRALETATTDIWLLQFDESGKNINTTKLPDLPLGMSHMTMPLTIGKNQTIYIIANGLRATFTTTSPATLTDFETKMLFPAEETSGWNIAIPAPLSGKLSGVTVVDLGGGRGAIQLDDASSMIILRRIHAEVTLIADIDVEGYLMAGTPMLLNVPTGAVCGWGVNDAIYPATDAANFLFTNTTSLINRMEGLRPIRPTAEGTKFTARWFVGDNRRGVASGISSQSDRNNANAPTYATFARIGLRKQNTSLSGFPEMIFYDIYLGSGSLDNFDIVRNHTYTITASIKGSTALHESLPDIDKRVSNTLPIYLTDKKDDSPIIISSKYSELTERMQWSDTKTDIATGATNVFDGQANTNTLISVSGNFPVVQYCRYQLGDDYYLPAQAELALMYIYLDAIPEANRPPTIMENHSTFWSSTEAKGEMDGQPYYAWSLVFSTGESDGYLDKQREGLVRCLKSKSVI